MTAPDDVDDHRQPLRIAALAKQVPVPQSLELGPDGRLRRDGMALEMNPYCRRAVAQGVSLAKASAGSCTVFTLGPPSAEDVLREAVAWGADGGVHLCDPAFAGSDTLATARALAAAVQRNGIFDVVLVGRSSVDSGTGQVGPELAELLDLPFASGARRMRVAGRVLHLGLEHEDGWEEVEVRLPALVSVAERLCAPCKVDTEVRTTVRTWRIRRLTAAQLGDGPWGADGSPTTVGSTRGLTHHRERRVLSGDLATQVATAVRFLADRGALGCPGEEPGLATTAGAGATPSVAPSGAPSVEKPCGEAAGRRTAPLEVDDRAVAALVEPGRPRIAAELLGAAARVARQLGGRVIALAPAPTGEDPLHRHEVAARLGALGADDVLQVVSTRPASPLATEDVAAALKGWAAAHRPGVVLAPSTTFGCEVAARIAAALGAGLVGDAATVDVVDGTIVAGKPAFSGTLLADIACTSPVKIVTLRPGMLAIPPARHELARVSSLAVEPRGRVLRHSLRRDDEVDVLAGAQVVVGVGRGVPPGEYAHVHELATVLGAELVATRKVTDAGWVPRARQVGITGRSITPRLYVAVGLSGSLNHMLGAQAAGTVLAINVDPSAPVFHLADVGVVGDWREAVPLLTSHLRELAAP